MAGEFSVAVPYQFYNLVMSFVTILALLWGMVACKRVYRMLRVRSAVLNDRSIQIRGLGSYLAYFDGATRTHLDAVVHTRQSMPPVQVEAVRISSTVKSFQLCKTDRGFHVALGVRATVKTRIVCMVEYNSANFLHLAQQCKSSTPQMPSRLFQAFTGLREDRTLETATVLPRFQRGEVCSFECMCSEVGAGDNVVVLPFAATATSWLAEKIGSVSGQDERLNFAVMLVPVEESDYKRTRKQAHPTGSSSGGIVTYNWRGEPTTPGGRRNAAGGDGDGDEEEGMGPEPAISAVGEADGSSESAEEAPLRSGILGRSLGFGSSNGAGVAAAANHRRTGRNPMTAAASSPSKAAGKAYEHAVAGPGAGSSAPIQSEPPVRGNAAAMFAAVFVHSASLHGLRNIVRTVEGGPWAAVLSATEVTVLDDQCSVFQSQEIFGLGGAEVVVGGGGASVASSSTQAPSGPSSPAPSVPGSAPPASGQAANASMGGRLVAEDCVVCLTIPKSVLLLPCRHLCVCESCLVFLDKCPVCRAPFEEYASIRADSAQGTEDRVDPVQT